MFTQAPALAVDATQKQHLETLVRAGTTPQRLARRCQVILLASQGVANNAIAQQTGLSRPTVIATRATFARGGVAALRHRPPRRRAGRVLTPAVEQRILDTTLKTRSPHGTHWSVRTLARHLGVSRMLVHRVWQRHELQPHRVERFKLSKDPRFEEKVRDIVGLYLNPPERALVLCVDEKSQIQALDRTQPLLPMRPGQAERRSHDYKRHGTLSLFAALDVAAGKVVGRCFPRHRAGEFRKFLDTVEANVPADLDVHVIMDNVATHKTALIRNWFAKRPRWHVHFTPTSASWINQVERFFGLLTDKAIRRGVHRSTAELEAAIEAYIDATNADPKPFRWTKSADDILASINRFCLRTSKAAELRNQDTRMTTPSRSAPNTSAARVPPATTSESMRLGFRTVVVSIGRISPAPMLVGASPLSSAVCRRSPGLDSPLEL